MYKEEKRGYQPPKNPTKLGSLPHQESNAFTLAGWVTQARNYALCMAILFDDVTWV